MPVTTMDSLQTLAAVVDEDGAAISMYLDLSPSATPTGRDLASRANAMLDQLGERRPEAGDGRSRFDAGYGRVRDFLENDDARGGREVHGLALFACNEIFEAVPLWRPAGELATTGRRFALLPVASMQSRTSDVLLVEAGRELGRLIALHNGALVEVGAADQELEGRHHKGGWAQMNLQRWVDRAAELHMAEVARLVEQVHEDAGRPPIVVAATDENAAVVREHLGRQTSEAVIGQIGNARDMGEQQLLEELARWADAHDRQRESELLERAQLHGDLGGVLDAIYADRVDTLLVAPGSDPDVFTCPDCGRMADRAEVCEYDGAFMQHEPSGGDAVSAAAVLHAGAVWQLMDVDRRDLDPSGLGAVLRF